MIQWFQYSVASEEAGSQTYSVYVRSKCTGGRWRNSEILRLRQDISPAQMLWKHSDSLFVIGVGYCLSCIKSHDKLKNNDDSSGEFVQEFAKKKTFEGCFETLFKNL